MTTRDDSEPPKGPVRHTEPAVAEDCPDTQEVGTIEGGGGEGFSDRLPPKEKSSEFLKARYYWAFSKL